jgi:hypothetical protein
MFVRSYVVRSTHKVDASEWETLCKSLGHPGKVFIYEGESFLSMRRLNSQEASCFSTPPVYKSEAPFVGFSAFEPIDFKEGLSFSNIFDHKAYY